MFWQINLSLVIAMKYLNSIKIFSAPEELSSEYRYKKLQT